MSSVDSWYRKGAIAAKLCDMDEEAFELLNSLVLSISPAIQTWPVDYAEKMLAEHWGFRIRFSLCTFLLGNGASPGLIVEWAMRRKVLRYWESAMHLAKLLKEHQNGNLERAGKTYWDLRQKEALVIGTPNFAMENRPIMRHEDGWIEPPGKLYWDLPIAALQKYAESLPRKNQRYRRG